jgi:hypothetical protein
LLSKSAITLPSTLTTIKRGSTGQWTGFKETLLIVDRLIGTTEKLRPQTPCNRYILTWSDNERFEKRFPLLAFSWGGRLHPAQLLIKIADLIFSPGMAPAVKFSGQPNFDHMID